MSLKDRIKTRLAAAGAPNIARDLLPADFQADVKRLMTHERLSELSHEARQGHYIEIDVSPQSMTAYLSACVNPDKPPLTREDLMMAVAAAGVTHGTTEDELRKRLQDGVLSRSAVGVLVARGTRPVAGRAGFVEMLRRPYNPKLENVLLVFDPVNEDEEIARVHPPERGTPGTNVLGEEVPCVMTAEAEYRLNYLIKTLKVGNETSLIAGARGHILQEDQSLTLVEVLHVSGDLTALRGALTYNNDTVIHGNICDNTMLNIDGNLQVLGTVGSTQMRVSGNLEVAQGVFGRGAAFLDIKGEVRSRYLDEARLFATGKVLVEKEALNSTLWTRDQFLGSSAAVVGGRTFAHEGMTVLALGSERGLSGLAVAGLDYQDWRIEKELKPKIAELEERREIMTEEFRRSNPKLKKAILETLEKLIAEITSRKGEILSLQQHLKERNPRALIRVREAVYPGLTLMIAFTEFIVMEKIPGPVEFHLDRDNVRVRRVP